MLAWIIYSFATFGIGLVLSLVVSLFWGGPTQRAEKPHRVVIACIVLAMAGPFIYTEALTKWIGGPMEHAVRQSFADSPLDGQLQYFRVTKYTGSKATVIAIAQEKEGWGGTDRPVLEVDLSRSGASWVADSYRVVYSYRLNKDGLVFPPYQ